MGKFQKFLAAGLVATSTTAANAQEMDASFRHSVDAIFETLAKGVKPREEDLVTAIVTASTDNGQKMLKVAPDKQFALVIDPAKHTITALKLELTNDKQLIVEGSAFAFKIQEKPLDARTDSSLKWEAANFVTQMNKKIVTSSIPPTQSYESFIDSIVAETGKAR